MGCSWALCVPVLSNAFQTFSQVLPPKQPPFPAQQTMARGGGHWNWKATLKLIWSCRQRSPIKRKKVYSEISFGGIHGASVLQWQNQTGALHKPINAHLFPSSKPPFLPVKNKRCSFKMAPSVWNSVHLQIIVQSRRAEVDEFIRSILKGFCSCIHI